MNREDVLRVVAEARSKGERPNLRGANLRDANLRGANLRDADLRYADLRYADLRYADLWGADLRGANLWGANLRGADLWGGLRVDGLSSGRVTMVPTVDGWALSVGCWKGSIDDLAELIARDEGWPEAEGDEIAKRRPGLEAVVALARAHAVLHADKLDAVVEKWGKK